MTWEDVFKVQEVVFNEVDVELDNEVFSESCCEDARIKFLRLLYEKQGIHKRNGDIKRYERGNKLMGFYEKISCENLRKRLEMLITKIQNILNEWDECERGE